MRPRKHDLEGSGDLFRSRLDQIINMEHELVRLADQVDWGWIDDQVADCFAAAGRPGTETRFMIGILLLKQTYGLSDEGVWEPLGRLLTAVALQSDDRLPADHGSTIPISSTSPARPTSGTGCPTSARG